MNLEDKQSMNKYNYNDSMNISTYSPPSPMYVWDYLDPLRAFTLERLSLAPYVWKSVKSDKSKIDEKNNFSKTVSSTSMKFLWYVILVEVFKRTKFGDSIYNCFWAMNFLVNFDETSNSA